VSVPQISATQAAARGADGSALLLDVREDDEWSAGHAEGMLHLPMSRLDLSDIPLDRPIIVVCRSGNRSDRVAEYLVGIGVDAANMAGGMHAWVEAGMPIVQDDGSPGFVR
jgi:rhodanese-related sulfurtransferase